MAQQIMQQQNSLRSIAPSGTPGVTVSGGVDPGGVGAAAGQSGSTPPAPTAGLPELLSPAQAAESLGVSEADVMQSLESGELKGKKIGSSYRITRAALNEFLQS